MEDEKEGAASTPAVSESVFLYGLAGAKLRLSTTGDAGFSSISRGYRLLASRWPTTCSFADAHAKDFKVFKDFQYIQSLSKSLQRLASLSDS